jgi:hypothetical protein
MKKNWKVILLLSSISIAILLSIISIIGFLGYRNTMKYPTLNHDGNKYYGAAFFYVNLAHDKKEAEIFGESTFVGSYKETEFKTNVFNQLWSIEGISKNRLLVEMTPKGQEATTRIWVNTKIKNIQQAFDFLNPSYLSYLDYENEKMIPRKLDPEKQKEVTHIVRKMIETKPDFTRLSTIGGESIHEIYFNNDSRQSLVLQASLLKINNGKVYMMFGHGMGRIAYWEVSDELLKLLS